MSNPLLEVLKNLTVAQAGFFLLAENIVVFISSVIFGYALLHLFRDRRVALSPERIEATEIVLTLSTLLLNTLVTLVGWWLWREDYIRFRTDFGVYALLDCVVLFLVMDVAMYGLHRVAHVARVFPIVHRTHHRYDKPQPLTLFVLNPIEALSFGGLWLGVLLVYSFSWLGMSLYLVLNVIFGTIGHLGVEPLPPHYKGHWFWKWLATSSFHAQHHIEKGHNFGFYTLIWDRLFGTLSPDYESDFGRIPATAFERPG